MCLSVCRTLPPPQRPKNWAEGPLNCAEGLVWGSLVLTQTEINQVIYIFVILLKIAMILSQLLIIAFEISQLLRIAIEIS